MSTIGSSMSSGTPAQTLFTPSLHQRRLWQRERQLEEEAMELNLMIARHYSDQRAAAARAFGSGSALRLAIRLRLMTASRVAAGARRILARLLRDERFQRVIKAALRISLWLDQWR